MASFALINRIMRAEVSTLGLWRRGFADAGRRGGLSSSWREHRHRCVEPGSGHGKYLISHCSIPPSVGKHPSIRNVPVNGCWDADDAVEEKQRNRDRNFTKGKVERRRAQLEESVARYLSQLETADRQEPTEALAAKAEHLKEKLARLDGEMKRLESYEKKMLASLDQQISLTDPDSRSMATSGRGSGVVGYNVQVAVETENHLIVTHEVTTSGPDRSQLARIGKAAKSVLGTDRLEAVADRGYFNSPEILECHEAGITVTLPKPMTSGAKSEGRFGKQDFVYIETQDAYICPAGRALTCRMTTQEGDKAMRRYWTTACGRCSLKKKCTTAPERRIPRWEHEQVLEAVQARLDADPQAMRRRRETVEHPFGTLKARMGATHFLMRTLPKVAAEMALHVLAYNLTRVMNIMDIKPLMAAIRA